MSCRPADRSRPTGSAGRRVRPAWPAVGGPPRQRPQRRLAGQVRAAIAGGALAFGAVCVAAWPSRAAACEQPASACFEPRPGGFALIQARQPASVYVDPEADPAVQRVADDLVADLQRVGGLPARRITELRDATGRVVVIGVVGQSALLARLAAAGRWRAEGLAGRWEAFHREVVERPWEGVEQALVIAGADRRGAIYGTYDLAEQIGVSPWHWFADVPVPSRPDVWVSAGFHRDAPKVKYRGFFINDEDPAFSSWARRRFGGVNAELYGHVFELLLRLKGNLLWPAMWRKAFAVDDPQNMVLADRMGVVMGTSHHEPMMRAQDEWRRQKAAGLASGPWDHAGNGDALRRFWRGGIERMMSKGPGRSYESVVTIGMRGDGDEPMTEGTAIPLLERVVADQRRIIAEVSGRPPEQVPQVWALYKEVLDYLDQGMRVPDDVTLLFADDNWGQIRRLPAGGPDRPGGAGVYVHFDYVGGPRSYTWLNTVQIEKTWQQMDLAYQRGARAMWIVNVGDIKPMEFPLSFFLRQAWDPEAMTPAALKAFPGRWAGTVFGPAQGTAIGRLLTRYSQLAARRKPELLDADTYATGALTAETLDGGEFGAVVADWSTLEAEMLAVKAALPAAAHDAYVQLVEHPIAALANLHRLYQAVAWNRRLAASGDPRANAMADAAVAAFARDQALTERYHRLGGGKWDGMMAQAHIGYTSWQSPKVQALPALVRVDATGPVPEVRWAAPVQAGRPAATDDARVIEATDFSRAAGGAGLSWQVVAHLGSSAGAVLALPQGRAPTGPGSGVRLEYDLPAARAGDLTVQLVLVPTLDTTGSGVQRIGVSLDDGPVITIEDRLQPTTGRANSDAERDWVQAVKDNARVVQTTLRDVGAGPHVLKVWRLDDNVVLQRLVVRTRPACSVTGSC